MATQAVEEKSASRKTQQDDRQTDNGSPGRDQDQDQDDHGDESMSERAKSGASSVVESPIVRFWVLPAVVALIFSVGAAAAYWHFAGSGGSGSEKSSSKGSSKSSGSSKGKSSNTSKGENSSQGSDASHESNRGKEDVSSKRSDASNGSDSGKGSDSSQDDSGTAQLAQVEAAWHAALNEVRAAQDAENAARQAENDMKAVLSFFKKNLLTAGRPGDTSLAAAFWAGGQGKDISLRKAVDMTDARVAEAFADRPLSEASVREMLGWAYLSLGDAPKAIEEYERAFTLREALQGDDHAETAACRNQLAVTYRLAGRPADAARLFDRNPNSPTYAAALEIRGAMLLLEKKPAQAELKLRACLTIRQKTQPDDWSTYDAMSMLGDALADQGKFAEAEPLLTSGYEGLKLHKDQIPDRDKVRFTRALERLIKLYGSWGQPDKALKWRQQLTAAQGRQEAQSLDQCPARNLWPAKLE